MIVNDLPLTPYFLKHERHGAALLCFLRTRPKCDRIGSKRECVVGTERHNINRSDTNLEFAFCTHELVKCFPNAIPSPHDLPVTDGCDAGLSAVHVRDRCCIGPIMSIDVCPNCLL